MFDFVGVPLANGAVDVVLDFVEFAIVLIKKRDYPISVYFDNKPLVAH